ncbi:hypothetical protein O0I10_005585 [Lichtheimia ornata]|uniref:Major facilitator superfamily (MFS) profile domain-containing protein n=1 Tax=Lichtheimia ornata TaxID=688661 RepID=A0AAD7V4H2_9FUNG|nr:uncharacterized protein O0I10_005585 [Lichtheimia ornata]KAJ8658857.1 hypothetical protein O0I10_005585 [Lichtheimia ornata]
MSSSEKTLADDKDRSTSHSSIISKYPSASISSCDRSSTIQQREKQNEQEEEYEGWHSRGWLTVLGSFLIIFCLASINSNWGVFEVLYLEVYPEVDPSIQGFTGPLASGVSFLMGPISVGFVQWAQSYRWPCIIATFICPTSLILASFSTQFYHVMLSQAILFNIGSGFVYLIASVLPAQWFSRNRSLASCCAASGACIGPLVMAPIIQAMIDSPLGYRNTLRVLGAIIFVLLATSTVLIRPASSDIKHNPNWYKLIDPELANIRYILLTIGIVLTCLAFYPSYMLVPVYAQHIGASATLGSGLVSVMFATNAISRIGIGYVADRLGVMNTLFATTLLCGIWNMVIWQLSYEVGVYVLYLILFGITGGVFFGLIPSCVAQVANPQLIQKGVSLIYLLVPIGIFPSGLIAGALFSNYSWTVAIQFLGSVFVLASIVILIVRLLVSNKPPSKSTSSK